MGLNDAVDAIPRKTMVLFFILDTSSSMMGSKIGALNTAIEEVIPELQALSASNADAQIKVAVLEFNSSAGWITQAPLEVTQFHWTYLDACGCTAMGAAMRELDDKLSTKVFMKEATGSFAPALFLLSDGAPTDNFIDAMAELRKNNWFKQGIKVAVAIGDDADKNTLAEFTGSTEAVIEVHNAKLLKKMIKFVSVRASQVASQSVQAGTFQTVVQTQTPAPSATPLDMPQPNAAPAVPVQAAPLAASPTAPAIPAAAAPSPAPVTVPVPPPTIKQQMLNAQIAQMVAAAKADDGEDEW